MGKKFKIAQTKPQGKTRNRESALKGERLQPLPWAGVKPAPAFSWTGVTVTPVIIVYQTGDLVQGKESR